MRVRQQMREEKTDALLVSALDDIAWTLNIRGADVEFNPVVYAYLLIFKERAVLFIDKDKVSAELVTALGNAEVEVVDYDKTDTYLSTLASDLSLWVDPALVSHQLVEAVENATIFEKSLPIQGMKAIKNETEVQHIRHAMVKDGVALVHTFKWLEEEIQNRTVKETELAEKLAHFRSQQDSYKGESFAAIVGYKGNGAIVHYRAEEDSCAEIKAEGALLVDSGGQYLDGTTDITRTFHFDEPSDEFKEAYTRVLKGHIGLARAIFPENTRGVQLDILARQYLWDAAMNYGHGTGHGVGFYLNVHEPPQGFVPGLGQRGVTKFKKGMFTSNEPGYYKENEYGIRIENLVLAVEKEDNEHGRFLCFESLTLYPINTDLIQHEMLTEGERKWLNDYHHRVFQALAPRLEQEERQWLKSQCAEI
jgi:Xaa-Pro aminopeptidase